MGPGKFQLNDKAEKGLGEGGAQAEATLACFLEKRLVPGVAVLGLGSWNWGDDAAGLLVGQRLLDRGYAHVCLCESSSTHWMQYLSSNRFKQVLLIDAVEAGQAPGSVVCLESDEIQSRFPQISTHKLSLGLIARWMRLHGVAQVLMLGIQPSQLREAIPASPSVLATVDALVEVLTRLLLPGCEISHREGERTAQLRVNIPGGKALATVKETGPFS